MNWITGIREENGKKIYIQSIIAIISFVLNPLAIAALFTSMNLAAKKNPPIDNMKKCWITIILIILFIIIYLFIRDKFINNFDLTTDITLNIIFFIISMIFFIFGGLELYKIVNISDIKTN